MFPALQRLMTIVSMRVARACIPIPRVVSALASANNFSHPENRWPVLHRIGGETVCIGIHATTHAVYMCAAFFPISFPAGIFICYGLEFRLVCLQRGRCSVHSYHAGGHAKGQKSGFGSPFSPCSAAYKPLLFFPARCGGYVSRRVYHLIRRETRYIIIYIYKALARGFRSKKYPS